MGSSEDGGERGGGIHSLYLLGARRDCCGWGLEWRHVSWEAEVAAGLWGGRGGGRVGIVSDEEGAALAFHGFDIDAHQAVGGLPGGAVAGATAQAAAQCGCGDVEEPGSGVRMAK